MSKLKVTARITGILFIVATVAAIFGDILMGSSMGAPDYLVQMVIHKNLIVLGTLFKIVGAAASAGIAISLYPVLRKQNEGLALGAVGFRLIEGVFYAVAALSVFALLSLGQVSTTGSQITPATQALGTLILAISVWAGFIIGVIFFCLGASMYYYALYQSRLIPRWLSVWGIVGLIFVLTMALLLAFGEKIAAPSGMQVMLALPIALQEMVLAVWLIVKGFNLSAMKPEVLK